MKYQLVSIDFVHIRKIDYAAFSLKKYLIAVLISISKYIKSIYFKNTAIEDELNRSIFNNDGELKKFNSSSNVFI